MSLLSGEIYGLLYWNQSELKFMGKKKINTAKDSFKDISGKGSQGAVFCLDMFPCHSCNFYFYFFGLFSSIHYFPFQRFVATEMHKLKAECCYITKFRRRGSEMGLMVRAASTSGRRGRDTTGENGVASSYIIPDGHS